MQHEKHKAKKDAENAHGHKVKEEVAAVAAAALRLQLRCFSAAEGALPAVTTKLLLAGCTTTRP